MVGVHYLHSFLYLTCGGSPPAAGIVVKELEGAHQLDVVPLPKHDHIQAELTDVTGQLLDLLLMQECKREETICEG